MNIRKQVLSVLFLCLCLPTYALASCSATAAKGTVALTFDDGPSVQYTQKVLGILEKNHIKATFFVVGRNAQAHPKLLKEMVADGDIIGNHSMTHPQIPRLNAAQLQTEVVAPENIIAKITGKKPKLFRFPYGAENTRVKNYVISQGMIPVFWGYSSEDYRRPGSAVIAKRVIDNARSGQVILLHDGPKNRQQTVDALPEIIAGIKKKGLGFSVLCS